MKHQKQLLTVLLMSAASMLQAQRSDCLLYTSDAADEL